MGIRPCAHVVVGMGGGGGRLVCEEGGQAVVGGWPLHERARVHARVSLAVAEQQG